MGHGLKMSECTMKNVVYKKKIREKKRTNSRKQRDKQGYDHVNLAL